MNRSIGVLDSGVGGLTVARELMRQLPHEQIIYVGDTLRCPYGPRPEEEIRQFTWEMIDYLVAQDVKLIVIACNTATAVVLKEARQKLSIPIIGVIDPGARAAVKVTRSKRIGVIGTKMTIESNSYEKALRHVEGQVVVESLACPPFVPLVESSQTSGSYVERVVVNTLKPLLDYDMDTLILGCTHYPLLAEVIGRVIGPDVQLISSGDETALEVSALLDYNGITADLDNVPEHVYHATGDTRSFERIASDWLNQSVQAKRLVLGTEEEKCV
ncbi:glutamate racemase [Exiguobacterium sp. S22-S28]|uniref:glutamate racemase n=1 Tax=Exiguobacterium sp. S22-S28 TaxID=3342768 RepID=UPI00372D5727